MGNSEPVFLSRHLQVLEARQIGNVGQHIRLKLKQGSAVWDAVGWDLGIYCAEVTKFIDAVFSLEMNHWNGDHYLRLNVVDFSPLG